MNLILTERLEAGDVQVAPVTLADAKRHLNVEDSDHDTLIWSLILAATARLDGPDGLLGRALITQTWQLKLDAFPQSRIIRLPLPPLQSVLEIQYTDPNGESQTLSSAITTGIGSANAQGTIRPSYGDSFPSTKAIPEAVSVSFTCGYGDEPEDVPAAIRQAILLDVGNMFENRESVVIGAPATVLPDGYMERVICHRVWSF